ncbi:MAG TPA: (2Fe-2S)-binding protein [Burkholderiales bacterium]|nr:(2Fe-2S)-binding protein [Burkholderiales bacterium]
MANTNLTVNGVRRSVTSSPDTPLLYVLRDELGQLGPKFGCGLAQCGACTVIIEGRAVRSCVTPISAVKGNVRTLDGIGTAQKPHPVQKAFIDEQAAACGYCANGWIMNTVAVLEKDPKLSDEQLRQALSGLKCRCGTHMAILRAARKAADSMA